MSQTLPGASEPIKPPVQAAQPAAEEPNNLKQELKALGIDLDSPDLGLGSDPTRKDAPTEAGTGDAAGEGSRPWRLGNIVVRPTLTARWGHDDNVTQVRPGAPKVASNVVIWSPSLSAGLDYKGDRYGLDYQGSLSQYSISPGDSTSNHMLMLNGANQLSLRNALRWNLSVQDGFNPRGSTDRDVSSASAVPSHFRNYRYGAAYGFGAPGAKGRIELEANHSSTEYLNNLDLNKFADFQSNTGTARFLWRVLPKTSLVTEVVSGTTAYTNPLALSDSKFTNLMLGVDWSATTVTSSSLRVGSQKRQYDYAGRGTFTGLNWTASMSWKPLSYSSFDFMTSRNVMDTANGPNTELLGRYSVISSFQASWRYAWKPNLTSELRWLRQNADYVGSTPYRVDRLDSLSTGLFYGITRWADLGLDVTRLVRRGSLEAWYFDRLQTWAVLRLKF